MWRDLVSMFRPQGTIAFTSALSNEVPKLPKRLKKENVSLCKNLVAILELLINKCLAAYCSLENHINQCMLVSEGISIYFKVQKINSFYYSKSCPLKISNLEAGE